MDLEKNRSRGDICKRNRKPEGHMLKHRPIFVAKSDRN